ncbi:hypothetical protein MMC16_007641, partial [Acarospora aff. strigata]|nr:hypothetical protein [Acarospora aff. strigata]
MDLVAGVRKEGSRYVMLPDLTANAHLTFPFPPSGGRAEFKWEDVKSDQHRENYLGHSLMAPVGRWQKNRDLSWYATSSTASANETAAQQRATEIRLIKEAERDALSAALGFAVTPRLPGTETSGAERKEVERVVRETADEELDGDGERGVGFGAYTGGSGPGRMLGEKGGGERIARHPPVEPSHAHSAAVS